MVKIEPLEKAAGAPAPLSFHQDTPGRSDKSIWVGKTGMGQFSLPSSSCNSALLCARPRDLMHPGSMTIFTFLFSYNNHAPSPLCQWDCLSFNRKQGMWTERKTSNMEFQVQWVEWGTSGMEVFLIAQHLGQSIPNFYYPVISLFPCKRFLVSKIPLGYHLFYYVLLILQFPFARAYNVTSTLLHTLHAILKLIFTKTLWSDDHSSLIDAEIKK